VQDARLGESACDIARQGSERVIADQRTVVSAVQAGDRISDLCLLGGGTYRTKIGSSETKAGHGLLLHDWLGGIWEVASGANRPEPLPTELNQSL
jgi:hypothetical protein